MGKRIACICGKPGRVQHTRMKFLRDNYMSYLDVYADDVPDLSKYDVVYFSHYSLAKKVKFDGKRKYLASVTSHKYDKKELGKFDRISVNNRILLEELAEFNPVLTENGVDTKFWKPLRESKRRHYTSHIVIGWVGTRNRKAKRFGWLVDVKSLLSVVDVSISPVFSWKSDRELPKTKEEMLEYYNTIDVLLVTSESEGTPNPALEAMSCGVPVLATRVGNLPDIPCVHFYDSREEMFFLLGNVPNRWYSPPNEWCVEEMVENWDWSIKYRAWDDFFKEWL